MQTKWKQIDKERERVCEEEINAAKIGSAAKKDFFGAAQSAHQIAKENEILGVRNEHGEFRYTIQQGLRAACHGREDISATLLIQLAVLKRLDRNRNLLWLVIVLLAYLAYRLS